MEDKHNKLRQEAWDLALHSFGKRFIFDRRAEKFSKYINALKVFGIVTPVSVGATAMGYGTDSQILKPIINIAVPLLIIQLLFSVLAVIFKWDDELAYSYEASQDYNNLSNSFRKLGNTPPVDIDMLEKNLDILGARYQARTEQDAKHSVKEWELRRGMRYALREFRRECVGCRITPVSMESTDCDVCGKFETDLKKGVRKWTRRLFM